MHQWKQKSIVILTRKSDYVAQEGKLNIFPNPAVNEINIRVEDYIGKYQLQLFNILGEKLLVKSVELNGQVIFTLDISSLAVGIYKIVLSFDSNVNSGTFVK